MPRVFFYTLSLIAIWHSSWFAATCYNRNAEIRDIDMDWGLEAEAQQLGWNYAESKVTWVKPYPGYKCHRQELDKPSLDPIPLAAYLQ